MSQAAIETEGDAPDVAVLLNGDPTRQKDGGGFEDDAFVICESELHGKVVDVCVSYGESGVKGVELDWPGTNATCEMEPVEDQPETGLKFDARSMPGIEAEVRILPVTEL